jgi:hypothetical protein
MVACLGSEAHGHSMVWRSCSSTWVGRAVYFNTPLQTDGSFYHQFVQNSKIAGSEAVEAA